jgi:hypothetical protein
MSLKESCTTEVDWSRIVRNMKGNFIIISESCSMLVVKDFFPRSHDRLGKIILYLMLFHALMTIFFCNFKFTFTNTTYGITSFFFL